MLDYTRTLLNKTVKDVSTAFSIFHFATQIIYIAYLIYSICVPNKIWYLHLALLIISVAFLIYDIIASKSILAIKKTNVKRSEKKEKRQKLIQAKLNRAKVQKIKFYTSHVLKLFVLASAFYPIIVMPDTVHPLSIMCTTVMLLLWVLLVVFEVIKIMFEARKDLFMEAIQADVEFITKPINKIKDTVNMLVGKETEEKAAPTQNRVYLDGLVKTAREEKAQKKAEAKALRNEKLSVWLDKHLSKITKKKKNYTDEKNEPQKVDESSSIEKETTEKV